jgi:hypothetical protein
LYLRERKTAIRGVGTDPVKFFTTVKVIGPVTLIIAIPDFPDPVDKAKIVLFNISTYKQI